MEEIEKLKKQRQSTKAALTRIYTFCINESAGEDEVRVRALRADELFKEFEKVQQSIELLVQEDKLPDEDKYRADVEHKYFAIKSVALRLSEDAERNQTIIQGQATGGDDLPSAIQALLIHQNIMGTLLERFVENTRSEQAYTPTQNSNIITGELRLPRIQIPEFDGNSLDWIRFRDLFEAMVHSKTSISAVEKLEYLQTKLKGEALSLTRHLKLSNENYEVAWDIIKKRYNDSDKVKKSYFELLIDQPRLKAASLNEIKLFTNNINESYNALKVLSEPVEHWNSILMYILEKKLDEESATLWFREKQSNSTTSFSTFVQFLERRIFELENTHKSDFKKRNQIRTFAATVLSCPICSEDHHLFNCNRFKEMDIENRRQIVRQHNICYNCLQPNHKASECNRSLCKKCNKRHNTLLHITTNQQQQNHTYTATASEEAYVSVNTTQQSYIILPTARIMVQDQWGVLQSCRAMLDSCSQRTLISEACVARLQKKRSFDKTAVYGVGNGGSSSTKGKIEIQIHTPGMLITTEALCLPNLTQQLPTREIGDERLNFFQNLTLADPSYRKPGKIDIIIGADIYLDCCLGDQIKHPSGFPSAMRTIFGWVIMGKTLTVSESPILSAMVHLDLNKQMQRFWETEELPAKIQHLTQEEQKAEDHYKQHVQRNQNGRYIVRLPLKDNVVNLGESKANALKRLYAMERRFTDNNNLRDEYIKFMNNYIELGHMVPATNTPTERVCYLPHHAVIKPSSSTTKLRVVYDASCKTSNGLSLNDNLLVWPVVQNDLFDIVTKFRKFKIGFTADIEKMYRQILVHPEDQSLQRIVWRNSVNEKPVEYNLKTVTYGTSAAPFLATRTLQQISNDYSDLFPIAADSIKQHFYVDDFMFCATDECQAVELKEQIIHILSNSGLHLRKWSSNS